MPVDQEHECILQLETVALKPAALPAWPLRSLDFAAVSVLARSSRISGLAGTGRVGDNAIHFIALHRCPSWGWSAFPGHLLAFSCAPSWRSVLRMYASSLAPISMCGALAERGLSSRTLNSPHTSPDPKLSRDTVPTGGGAFYFDAHLAGRDDVARVAGAALAHEA